MATIPLTRCDFCGGPAAWCFLGDELVFHCRAQCDGFMQLELFLSEGVRESMRRGAPDDSEEETWPSSSLEEGLPF